MYVSGVNGMKPFRPRDLARTGERRSGCLRFVEHLEIGMKRSEMPWHISSEIFCEPFRSAMQFVITVVLSGNQKRRNFEPDMGFVTEIFQRVEYRLKLCKTKPMVKRIGERLEIDVCGIHALVKFGARIIGDVTGGNRHRFDSAFATRVRNIHRVLGENHRIIVRERHRAAAEPFRCECDLLGRSCIREFVPLARFEDVPVLTKSAAEIASSGAKREDARPRQKMVKRFLLDRIDAKPAAPAISREHHPIAHALPNETKSALSFVQLAKPRTQSAFNAPIR